MKFRTKPSKTPETFHQSRRRLLLLPNNWVDLLYGQRGVRNRRKKRRFHDRNFQGVSSSDYTDFNLNYSCLGKPIYLEFHTHTHSRRSNLDFHQIVYLNQNGLSFDRPADSKMRRLTTTLFIDWHPSIKRSTT